MRLLRLLALAGLTAAGGCYHYMPYSPQEASPGQQVRLRLSPDEATKYADLRLENPRLLEGTVVERSSSELMLDASLSAGEPGAGVRVLTQRLNVPFTGVLDVELKELDQTRTTFLVAGGAVAVGLIVAASLGGSGRDDEGGTDNPEARRIPLLRFKLGF